MLAFLKAAAYGILDTLTRPWGLPKTVNGRTWRLSARCWRAFPDSWEPDLDRFLDESVQPGMVVADVGAHVGIHTLSLAHRVGRDGRVYAFEPVPEVAALLARHLRLNGFEGRVTLVERAVGDSERLAEMLVDPTGPDPGNSFVARAYARRLRRITVQVVTLAGFFEHCRQRPRVFKIDVEGYELRVLRGGAALFGSGDALIACALHPWHMQQLGDSEEAFFEEARAQGLEIHSLQGYPTRPQGVYREVILRRQSDG